jgi:hypothetical protein
MWRTKAGERAGSGLYHACPTGLENKGDSFMAKVGDSIREMFLFLASVIFLLFNLLDRQRHRKS